MILRRILQVISWTALAGVVVPPLMYLLGDWSLDTVKNVMLVATLVWFASSVLWMGRKTAEVA